jgi:molybdopterin/thiamine biosynthesis adenylyltransferase
MLILGVDNERTKLFVTYHRMRSNKPMAVLGFWGWEASFMLSIPGKTACYTCLFRPNSENEVKRIGKARKCPKPEPNIPGAVIHGTVTSKYKRNVIKRKLKEHLFSVGVGDNWYDMEAYQDLDIRFLIDDEYQGNERFIEGKTLVIKNLKETTSSLIPIPYCKGTP